jgi:hypothetical protein
MWEMIKKRRQLEREVPPVLVGRRDAPFPLSASQDRLWRVAQTARTASIAYNVTYSVRLVGPLDYAAFWGAVRKLAERHEALRTVFGVRDGGPVQLVRAELEPETSLVDGADGPPAGDDPHAGSWVDAEAARRFDLAVGPLFRVALYRARPDEHVMFVAVHHIVFDGWSLNVVLRELSTLYRSQLGGAAAKLPPPPLHFGDFVLWQRAWLRGPTLERYVDFWRRQLPSDASRPLVPPRSPSTGDSVAGGRAAFTVSRPITVGLRDLAREFSTTLFVVLLAAYQAVLHLESGRDDIVVAVPAANRARPELGQVVGYLVSVLPIRTRIRGDLAFRELLERVEQVVARAYAHQAMSWELLVENVELDGVDPDELPMSVFFAEYTRVGRGALDLPGVTASPFPITEKDTEFPLALVLFDEGEEVTGELSFNWDMYTGVAPSHIHRYLDLLAWLVTHPRTPLREYGAV